MIPEIANAGLADANVCLKAGMHSGLCFYAFFVSCESENDSALSACLTETGNIMIA